MLALLFLTGLVTMGMEVIWIRLFTPYAGPVVYSFAFILISYLSATFAGSFVYRRFNRGGEIDPYLAWVLLAFLGMLSLLTSDPRFPLNTPLRVLLGVGPFAGWIGYLTPMLVDRWAAGDPDRAGRAYAVNVLGCILGPLLSGFVLLPLVGERLGMLLFLAPWIVMAFLPSRGEPQRAERGVGTRVAAYASVAAALAVFFATKNFETLFPDREVLRDSTATVIATGTGMHKRLLTNGIGITQLTPITKMMAHLTLASLPAATAQRAGDLLWNGDDLQIGDVVGHSRDRRGTDTERTAAVHVLSSRWRSAAGLAALAPGDRRWATLHGADA